MEKWRIYSLLGALILAILSAISWYWVLEFSLKQHLLSEILQIGWMLLLIIALMLSFFALFLFFYPFFVTMELGGSRAWRNYVIFFSVLLCFPIIYLIVSPSFFVNGMYSWVSLAVFGYGAIHSYFKFFDAKQSEYINTLNSEKIKRVESLLNEGNVEEAEKIADTIESWREAEAHCLIASYYWDKSLYRKCFKELEKISDDGTSFAIRTLLAKCIENNWVEKKAIVLEHLVELFPQDADSWDLNQNVIELIKMNEIATAKRIMAKVISMTNDKELLGLIQKKINDEILKG